MRFHTKPAGDCLLWLGSNAGASVNSPHSSLPSQAILPFIPLLTHSFRVHNTIHADDLCQARRKSRLTLTLCCAMRQSQQSSKCKENTITAEAADLQMPSGL